MLAEQGDLKPVDVLLDERPGSADASKGSSQKRSRPVVVKVGRYESNIIQSQGLYLRRHELSDRAKQWVLEHN